jgi:hypothetical protein
MSNANKPFDFSQFVPGFDFLKNLAGGAAAGAGAGSVPGIPSLASWVAPTLSVEEVDKRIQELKTVQYWLEQNGHALKATIQALEVQKMTLVDLRGMNVRMEDIASAFTKQAAQWRRRPHPQPAAPEPEPEEIEEEEDEAPEEEAPAPAPRSRAPRPASAGKSKPVVLRRGRSDAVVGLAHRAVPADRQLPRCRTRRSSRCRPWPSRWPMPSARRWASRLQQRSQPRIHFQVRLPGPASRSRPRATPAAKKKTATAARKRTSGRR